jgi:hypothetical protein
VISPICHSLNSTYAAIASAARNDFDVDMPPRVRVEDRDQVSGFG